MVSRNADSSLYRSIHILLAFSSHNLPPADFAIEIWGSLKFFVNYARGKPDTRGSRLPTITEVNGKQRRKLDFGQAFGVYPAHPVARGSSTGFSPYGGSQDELGMGGRGGESRMHAQRASYEEDIRLAPYTYGNRSVGGDIGASASGLESFAAREMGVGSQQGHLRTDWHEDDESSASSNVSASSARRLVSPGPAGDGGGVGMGGNAPYPARGPMSPSAYSSPRTLAEGYRQTQAQAGAISEVGYIRSGQPF